MHPLRKRPLFELLVIVSVGLSVMIFLRGVNRWIALTTRTHEMTIARMNTEKNNDTLREVAANCPYQEPDKLGSTQNPWGSITEAQVDSFNKVKFIFEGLSKLTEARLDFPNPGDDGKQPKLHTITGADTGLIFYQVNSKVSMDHPGTGQVVEIPTESGQIVRMPDSGYRISTGIITGIVFGIDGDGVRIAFSRTDKPTAAEGYNLYIYGLQVDKDLVTRFNKGNSVFARACMPQISVGDVLGVAKSTSIFVALRDNGQLLPLHSKLFWSNTASIKSGQSQAPTPTNSPTTAATVTVSTGTTAARSHSIRTDILPVTAIAPDKVVALLASYASPYICYLDTKNTLTCVPTRRPNVSVGSISFDHDRFDRFIGGPVCVSPVSTGCDGGFFLDQR